MASRPLREGATASVPPPVGGPPRCDNCSSACGVNCVHLCSHVALFNVTQRASAAARRFGAGVAVHSQQPQQPQPQQGQNQQVHSLDSRPISPAPPQCCSRSGCPSFSDADDGEGSDTLYHAALFPVPLKSSVFPGEYLHMRISLGSALYLFADATTTGLQPDAHPHPTPDWPSVTGQAHTSSSSGATLLQHCVAIAASPTAPVGALAAFRPATLVASAHTFNIHLIAFARYRLMARPHWHRPYPCILISLLCDRVPRPFPALRALGMAAAAAENACGQRVVGQERKQEGPVEQVPLNERVVTMQPLHRGAAEDAANFNDGPGGAASAPATAASTAHSRRSRPRTRSQTLASLRANSCLQAPLATTDVSASSPTARAAVQRNGKRRPLNLYPHSPYPQTILRLLHPPTLISRAYNAALSAASREPPALDPTILANPPPATACPSSWSFWLCAALPSTVSPEVINCLLAETSPVARLTHLVKLMTGLAAASPLARAASPVRKPPRKRRKISPSPVAVAAVRAAQDVAALAGVQQLQHQAQPQLQRGVDEAGVGQQKAEMVRAKGVRQQPSARLQRMLQRNPWPCSSSNGFQRVNLRYPCRGRFPL